MKLLVLLIFSLAQACTTLPEPKSSPIFETKVHPDDTLERWLSYRAEVRRASYVAIIKEHRELERKPLVALSIDERMRLVAILMAPDYLGYNLSRATDVLSTIKSENGLSEEQHAVFVLLYDFSRDLALLVKENKKLKYNLDLAIKEKDGFAAKIQALTSIEQSLRAKAQLQDK